MDFISLAIVHLSVKIRKKIKKRCYPKMYIMYPKMSYKISADTRGFFYLFLLIILYTKISKRSIAEKPLITYIK